MREFMLDSEARAYRAGEVIFERNAPGSSLFGIADGEVRGRDQPQRPVDHRADRQGARFSVKSA